MNIIDNYFKSLDRALLRHLRRFMKRNRFHKDERARVLAAVEKELEVKWQTRTREPFDPKKAVELAEEWLRKDEEAKRKKAERREGETP